MWSVQPKHESSGSCAGIRGGVPCQLLGDRHKLVGYRWVLEQTASSGPRAPPIRQRNYDAPIEDDEDNEQMDTFGGTKLQGSQPKFTVGDRVRMRGYPGTISEYGGYRNQAIGIDRDFKHVYAIEFDDGEQDKNVPESILRSGDAATYRPRPKLPKTSVKRKRNRRFFKNIDPRKRSRVSKPIAEVIDLEQLEEPDEPCGPADADVPELESACEDGLLEVSERAFSARTRKDKLSAVLERTGCLPLSQAEQAVRYMGNCTEALDHFKQLGQNKVTPAKLRKYFQTIDGGDVWSGLGLGELSDFEFDHLLPMSSGGFEYLFNYFAMPKALNQCDEFKFYGVEKHTYIGRDVARTLKNYVDWNAAQAQSLIAQAEFQQVRTTYCPRGR